MEIPVSDDTEKALAAALKKCKIVWDVTMATAIMAAIRAEAAKQVAYEMADHLEQRHSTGGDVHGESKLRAVPGCEAADAMTGAAHPSHNTQLQCKVCGKPASQSKLRDPFGKSDAMDNFCPDHSRSGLFTAVPVGCAPGSAQPSPEGAGAATRDLKAENELLRAEIARQNIEMVAYREKLTPADAHAMKAVIDALYAAKRPADAGADSP
jgi:hypothetical protein